MIIKLHNNKNINIDIYNARNVILKSDDLIKIEKINNTVTKLIFSDGFYLEIGDLLPILHKDNTKLLHHISEITLKNNTYIISSEKINKTSHWLTPFVANNEEEIGYNTLLKNAYFYSDDEQYNFYEGYCLFLKYTYLKEEELFFKKLDFLPNCENVNPNHSNFEFVYILSFDDKWKEDIQLIIKGQYSMISEEAKKRILSFHNLTKTGITGCILYKDKEYMKTLQDKFDVSFELKELESKFNIGMEKLK